MGFLEIAEGIHDLLNLLLIRHQNHETVFFVRFRAVAPPQTFFVQLRNLRVRLFVNNVFHQKKLDQFLVDFVLVEKPLEVLGVGEQNQARVVCDFELVCQLAAFGDSGKNHVVFEFYRQSPEKQAGLLSLCKQHKNTCVQVFGDEVLVVAGVEAENVVGHQFQVEPDQVLRRQTLEQLHLQLLVVVVMHVQLVGLRVLGLAVLRHFAANRHRDFELVAVFVGELPDDSGLEPAQISLSLGVENVPVSLQIRQIRENAAVEFYHVFAVEHVKLFFFALVAKVLLAAAAEVLTPVSEIEPEILLVEISEPRVPVPKKHVEHVAEVSAALVLPALRLHLLVLLYQLLAASVIQLAQLFVVQHLISPLDLYIILLGPFRPLAVHVWVVLERHFFVGLADLLFGGGARDFEEGVVVLAGEEGEQEDEGQYRNHYDVC